MATISQVLYDTRIGRYIVRLIDDTGTIVQSRQDFATVEAAENWLRERLEEIGQDLGEELPPPNKLS